MKRQKRSFFQRAEAVLLSAVLIMGMISGAMPVSVLAQENEDKKDSTLIVSEFLRLPEDVREQTVPVGTGIEELMLPDTLEAVVLLQDSEGTPGEEKGETTDASAQLEDADKTDQAGDNADSEQDRQNPDAEINADTEESVETQSVSMQEYYTENTVTVKTLENVQEDEDTEQQSGDGEIIQIQGVTWGAEPEYDGSVEGVYFFTAVLPEGYALLEGVGLPEITVTVGKNSEDAIREILDRIAALPNLEEYLEKEPDVEQEEDYEVWMTALQEYAREALGIWEKCEVLTEEGQARVPAEQLARLTAWVELARQLAENSMIMTADISVSTTWTGTISDVTITGSSSPQDPVTITVSGDVTVQGKITVESGYVKFTGGGSLKWNSTNRKSNALEVAEGANVTFENVTLDGTNAGQFSFAALLLRGNVTFKNGTTIKKFSSRGGSGSPAGYKGVIAVYGEGILNIYDGTVITENTCGSGIIALYQFDDGNPSNKPSTAIVNMYGGIIEKNTVRTEAADMGVIWNWCGNLNISGGTVIAEGGEYAVHTQGNYNAYDAETVISGGTFRGMQNGAVCAGKDDTNNSKITITGGILEGAIAATVNYGTINIAGGSYKGSQYALKTSGGELNVSGGEFYGDTKAYYGNVTTQTDKVIIGESKKSVNNWDRSTSLNTYKYVAIGELEAKHKHDVSVNCSADSGTQVDFTALGNDGTLNSGNYYLESNKELTASLDVPEGAVVNLCLNGHELKYVGSEAVSIITVHGTLNLCDCNGSHGSHTFTSPATNAPVTLTGGLITKSKPVDMVGSGVYVFGSGTFNFYGGSIAGISDTGTDGIDGSHGAVRVEGTTHMYGGAITHNRSGCGGGVNLCSIGVGNACFYLHGGSVSYNYADYDDGGGICLNGRCSFEMDGGEIQGNRAKSGGGGIECYGPGDPADRVKLLDGVITGNTTGGDVGGGIKCGDTGRPLTVSGEIRITGNTNGGGTASNLYLCNGKTVKVDSGITGSAVVGITTESVPTAESPVNITGTNSTDCSSHFRSDDSAYTIKNDESNIVQLVLQKSDAEQVEEAKKVVEEALAGITAANDTTDESIQNVIDEALRNAGINLDEVTVSVQDLKKAEATSSAEGSIVGSIIISHGNAMDSVSINKTIEKLPKTDAEKAAEAKKVVEDVLNKMTASNDTTKESIQEAVNQALTDAGINSDEVTVTVGDLSKIEATSSTEGSVKGSITISSGSAQDGVTIEKTIAKLPKTDEEKVADAKKVVEDALKGIEATNATTKESLQNVINTALSEAGITNVTVTVGDLSKIEATGSKEGSVKGSITISSGSAQDGVTIEKTIAKLPKTDAEKVAEANKVVEEALAGVTVTNDTTRENLQDVIDAALQKAGITDVTVTVGDLNKTPATSGGAGSVIANISVSCGNTTENVPVNKPIAKLPDEGGNKPDGGTGKPEDNGHSGNESEGGGGSASRESNSEDSGSAENALPKTSAASGAYDPAAAETRVKSEQQGNIYKEVSIKAEDTFDTFIATQISELADIVLTEAEKQKAAGGTNIKIVLEVQDAQNMVSSEDKALVEAVLNSPGMSGFAVGQYLDISLFKIIGESRDAIHESDGKITITIAVPDRLKNTDNNKTRVFAVIRVHGGQAELLADLDSDEDTITIETDRFSPYAIVYKDMQGGTKNSGTKDKEPKTGDTEPVELFATLSMVAGVSYLLLYFTDRRHGMSEETKKEFVSRLVGWAKRGGKLRRLIAFLAIFILLVYYHSIGKSVGSEKWENEELEICGLKRGL